MIIGDAFAWILDPAHWRGSAGRGGPAILQRLGETLAVSAVTLAIVLVIAVPLGILIGHTGKGRQAAILASNVARALPTLGLLSILILAIGVDARPIVIVLVVLGIPPMLAGVYAGFESVNPETIDAARAVGMTEGQIVRGVELPLAAPLVVGGLRSTVLQIVATTTVGAYFVPFGFGAYLVNGLAQVDYVQMLAGAILVTALCLLLDGLLAVAQRLVAPRGLPRDATTGRSPGGSRQRAAAPAPRHTAPGTPALQEGTSS